MNENDTKIEELEEEIKEMKEEIEDLEERVDELESRPRGGLKQSTLLIMTVWCVVAVSFFAPNAKPYLTEILEGAGTATAILIFFF